jgi:hypothetical protein
MGKSDVRDPTYTHAPSGGPIITHEVLHDSLKMIRLAETYRNALCKAVRHDAASRAFI